MAGFLNVDLPSEDEEDEDYNVAEDKTAEKEDLPSGPGAQASTKRGGKRKRGTAVAAAPAARAAEPTADAADDSSDDDAPTAEEDPALRNPRLAAKRAKLDSLWLQLNVNAAAKGGGAPLRPPSRAVNLAELCHSASALHGKARIKAKQAVDPDSIWKRQLGLLPRKAPTLAAGNGSGGSPPPSSAANGGALGRHAPQEPAQAAATASADGHKPEGAGATGAASLAEERRALAAAALAAAKEAAALGTLNLHGKVAVTQVRRFAGRDIQVTLQVDKDSKEAQKAAAKGASAAPTAAAAAAGPSGIAAGAAAGSSAAAAAAPVPASGLDAVLADLEKKKKVSVLDKSKADWSEFKGTNANLEEELEAYKRSSNQYLDRQAFLKRAELREYEKERDKRLAADMRTRGRL